MSDGDRLKTAQFRASLTSLREMAIENIADAVAVKEVDIVLLAVLAAFDRAFGLKDTDD